MSHDDELLSYQISARLSGTSFGFLWTRMSSLGWTYDNNCSEYLTPFGINVGSANEAMATLDLFALPPLSFRPNSYDEGHTIMHQRYDAEIVEKLRITRNDLLKAIFVDYQERERKGKRKKCEGSATVISNDHAGRDDLNSNSRGDCIDSQKDDITNSHISSKAELGVRMKNTKEQTVSVTRNEPGTEQFFAKKVRKSGRSKNAQISYTHEKADVSTKICDTSEKNEEHRIDKKQKLIFGSSKLVWPNPQECVKALRRRETDSNENDQSQTSLRLLKKFASEWMFLLSTNHSIILYGFGSKRNLLNDFAEQELSNCGDVLTLDGYDSKISITGILDVLVQSVLGGKEPPYTETTTNYKDSLSSDLNRRAIAISKHIGRYHPRPVYLVLHNVDGLGLRSQAAQNCLAALVANSVIDNAQNSALDSNQITNNNAQVIRLITSVDRVDAVEILWNVTCMANFSWVSYYLLCSALFFAAVVIYNFHNSAP